MTDLVRVDPRYPGTWAKLSGYLQNALERGGGEKDWSLDDIHQAILEGRLALWAGVRGLVVFGAAVTCVTHYPRRVVLEVLAMGADAHHEDDWHECLEQMVQHAQDMGLQAIIGTGRAGWARKLGAKERRVFEIDLCTR